MFTVVAAWGIFSIFALAFQCHLPHPWNYLPPNCPEREGILYAVCTLNVVTDIFLAVYIFPDMFKLGVAPKERYAVLILFGARVVVCIANIVYATAVRDAVNNPDQTFANVRLTILESIAVHLSLITATIPRIHRYLAGLQAGLFSTQIPDVERRTSPQISLTMSAFRRSRTSRANRSARDTELSQIEKPLQLVPNGYGTHSSRVVTKPEHLDDTAAGYPSTKSKRATRGHHEQQSSTASLKNGAEPLAHDRKTSAGSESSRHVNSYVQQPV